MAHLIFVDVEATGPCPSMGRMTEFAAIDRDTKEVHYCKLADNFTEEIDQAVKFAEWLERRDAKGVIMVSDNPAFDFQFINDWMWRMVGHNPFGHSARRIGDFYAGLVRDFWKASEWKRLRRTKHTHNPIDDATGNVEAFDRMLNGERA